MPPITPADTLACLTQAFAEFTDRHVKKRPTPTIVADLGTLLFEQRIAEAEAALHGETKAGRIFRVSEVIETLRAKRNNDIREKSFRGEKSMQADLERKLNGLAAYSMRDGRMLRVVGPIHKGANNEVHLYLDVVEVEVEATTPASKKKVVRPLSPAGAQMLDAFNRLPEHERKKYDDAIQAGARVEVGRSRLGKRRVLLFSFLLLFSLGALARWIVVHYAAPQKEEQPSQQVGSTVDVTPPFRIEELRRIRVTPAMWYSLYSSGRSDICASNGVLVPRVKWKLRENDKDAVQPPFLILRNNEVYEDHITTYEKDFKDYGVEAGRVYNYAIGKRDPATGNIDIGPSVYSFTVGKCGTRNRDPVLGIFPDPPGGTAPVTITFDAIYSDDTSGGASFNWMFGDDSMVNTRARRVVHEYKYGGEYDVSVSAYDSEGGIGNASLHLSLAGPPAPPTPPPQEPERSWAGEPWAYVSKVRARTGEEIFLRATPSPIPSGATPVAYRWAFSDCYETNPQQSVYAKVRDVNCFSDPLTTPDFRKKFAEPRLFEVMLEITYDTGETMHRHLGKITVRPSEEYYAANPQYRTWYSEPAPTPPEWDRGAKPLGTYR